jgi:hypothetical protein
LHQRTLSVRNVRCTARRRARAAVRAADLAFPTHDVPRPYQDWVQYDLDIIPRFDACLRLDAVGPNGYAETRSSGADGEVALFKQLGKPVFYSVVDLYEWARRLQREGGPL